MSTKPYKIGKDKPAAVAEPATSYHGTNPEIKDWNPNIPFHGTQEEWWEHIHRIEEVPFISWEEAKKEFAEWEKEYLANRTCY